MCSAPGMPPLQTRAAHVAPHPTSRSPGMGVLAGTDGGNLVIFTEGAESGTGVVTLFTLIVFTFLLTTNR